MKRFLKIGAVAALAAAMFLTPQATTSAAEGVKFKGRSSIPVKHTLTNISGPLSFRYDFVFREKEGNPGVVTGINSPVSASANADATLTKQAMVDCSFNLTNLVFPKVGDYAFEIYEASSSDLVNYPLDTNRYEAYFHVYNVVDENNNPTGELRVTMDDWLYSVKDEAKVGMSANFSSEAGYSYVSLTNAVTGAASDTDKYFKYEVNFDGLAAGTKLDVVGQDAEIQTGNRATIPTVSEYTVSDEPLTVCLKHGQEVTIGHYDNGSKIANELPQGVTYTITKVDVEDGYTTKMDGEEIATVEKIVAASDNLTSAVNNREASVNTGAYVSVWPFVAVAVLSLSGLIIARKVTKSI